MSKYVPNEDADLRAFSARLRERAFDPSCCFLCANHFDDVHLTWEHVIPRWVQKRYNLWDQRLVLLNSTEIPYRLLTVPCCEDCNKHKLQPIESSMSSAVSKGSDAVGSLNPNTVFLWLGKIFYGILYREISLLLNRGSNDKITIATPELLREYEVHLFFLQQAREKVKLVDFTPGSIYTFKCQKLQDQKMQWDFCDNIETMFIAIRMGTVGIIAVLGDGGAQLIFQDEYREIIDLPLHPLQFRELCAHFSYRSSIATRTPKYITVEGAPHEVLQLPLAGLSAKPYFADWDQCVYGHYLAKYTGYPYDLVCPEPGKTMTWLHDESGAVRYIDFKKYPYGPQNR